MNDLSPTVQNSPTSVAPQQSPPPTADLSSDASSNREKLLQQLQTADAAFADKLGQYDAKAGHWSLLAAGAGVAASVYPIAKKLSHTKREAEAFASRTSSELKQLVDGHSGHLDFSIVKSGFEDKVRSSLYATGKRADKIVNAIATHYDHIKNNPSAPHTAQTTHELVVDEAKALLRSPFTRSPLGRGIAVVSSALTAGVVGHQLFALTHPREREAVHLLGRECRRLHEMTSASSEAGFEERLLAAREAEAQRITR
ncbi:MAG: hypothetical protein K2Q12_11085 [Rickettsiales bacterium]|nr:hypothetical protein [Rickettsiales bacterium]